MCLYFPYCSSNKRINTWKTINKMVIERSDGQGLVSLVKRSTWLSSWHWDLQPLSLLRSYSHYPEVPLLLPSKLALSTRQNPTPSTLSYTIKALFPGPEKPLLPQPWKPVSQQQLAPPLFIWNLLSLGCWGPEDWPKGASHLHLPWLRTAHSRDKCAAWTGATHWAQPKRFPTLGHTSTVRHFPQSAFRT